MSSTSLLEKMESFYRSMGYPVATKNNYLLVKGERPFVIEISPDNTVIRVTVLTEIEPRQNELEKILKLNFFRYGVKLSIDSEGFLAVISEAPLSCYKERSPAVIHEELVAIPIKVAEELEPH
jgi:hypothetical protein